jgi:hypothetical protein
LTAREKFQFGSIQLTRFRLPRRDGGEDVLYDVYYENAAGSGTLVATHAQSDEAQHILRELVSDVALAYSFVRRDS